jgi:hypothetical protein
VVEDDRRRVEHVCAVLGLSEPPARTNPHRHATDAAARLDDDLVAVVLRQPGSSERTPDSQRLIESIRDEMRARTRRAVGTDDDLRVRSRRQLARASHPHHRGRTRASGHEQEQATRTCTRYLDSRTVALLDRRTPRGGGGARPRALAHRTAPSAVQRNCRSRSLSPARSSRFLRSLRGGRAAPPPPRSGSSSIPSHMLQRRTPTVQPSLFGRDNSA